MLAIRPSTKTDCKTAGTIQVCPSNASIPTELDFRIIWNLCASFESSDYIASLNSPIFTLPGRDDCKWYINFHSLHSRFHMAYTGSKIVSTKRLILHPESDCKAVIAKFKLYIEDWHDARWTPCRVYKFFAKDGNCLSTSSLLDPKKILTAYKSDNPNDISNPNESDDTKDDLSFTLKIGCQIMIETVFPEYENFPKDFDLLLKNQQCTDVVVSAGNKSYPAHKAILIARSSVFAAMFAHDMTENQGEVKIQDMEGDVIEEMLRYIYTGKVEKLNDLAQDLLVAADKYDLIGLSRRCQQTLIQNLSKSNAIELLLFAQKYNAKELKFKAIDLISCKMKKLEKTSAWKKLDTDLVQEIKSHIRGGKK